MSALTALLSIDERRQPAAVARFAASGPLMRTEIVQTREGFDALAERWEALEAQVSGAVLFQGSGWARAIFDFEARRGNAAFDPVVVTLSAGRQLLAVVPLERIRTPLRTVLAPLGHAFSQYSDVLIAPGHDRQELLAQLLRAAIKAAPCDAVSFLKVRSDSVLAAAMPANHLVTGTEQGAPYVALSEFADYETYFHTLKPKTRKNMRNERNRLERDGAVTHHVAANTDETLGVVERTLSGRANRLREQGLSSRAFSNNAFTEFCTGLPGRSDLTLLAMSLQHQGEKLAEQWGFVHQQRYYAFVASRDFGHSEDSPGKLHLGEVIHACADRGLVGADLMVPVMPYKLTWATEVISVTDYALPVTPRGVLVLNVWDKRLRPALKAALLGMPRPLRSLLLRVAGRNL